MDRFVCVSGIDNPQIPEPVLCELTITTPESLHYQAKNIAAICSMNTNEWVRLPFCSTLLIEALGGRLVLSVSDARIKEPPYQKIDQLPMQPDWSTPRLRAMLDAMEILSSNGHLIGYNIEGPFTILCGLLPMQRVFSVLRKPAGQELLQNVEDWISQYTALAIQRGAQLISFADPVATMDILGERMFTNLYLPCLKKILFRLRTEHPEIIIHICGKLTQSLLDTKRCSVEQWHPVDCQTYGQALAACCKENQGGIVGHFCMNYLDSKRPYVSFIKFEEKEE